MVPPIQLLSDSRAHAKRADEHGRTALTALRDGDGLLLTSQTKGKPPSTTTIDASKVRRFLQSNTDLINYAKQEQRATLDKLARLREKRKQGVVGLARKFLAGKKARGRLQRRGK